MTATTGSFTTFTRTQGLAHGSNREDIEHARPVGSVRPHPRRHGIMAPSDEHPARRTEADIIVAEHAFGRSNRTFTTQRPRSTDNSRCFFRRPTRLRPGSNLIRRARASKVVIGLRCGTTRRLGIAKRRARAREDRKQRSAHGSAPETGSPSSANRAKVK